MQGMQLTLSGDMMCRMVFNGEGQCWPWCRLPTGCSATEKTQELYHSAGKQLFATRSGPCTHAIQYSSRVKAKKVRQDREWVRSDEGGSAIFSEVNRIRCAVSQHL